MNEKDLKEKINALRHEIDKRNKDIRKLYREINFHKAEADKLRIGRDESGTKIKKVNAEAKEFIKKRDEVNKEISELKKKRSLLLTEIKNLRGNIKDTKVQRDELNRIARSTNERLQISYESSLDTLLNKDIPLQDEIRIFENLFEIRERLIAAKKANIMHQSVSRTYENMKDINKELDDIHSKIQNLAQESQKNHEDAMRIYKEIDELRKYSDECHRGLLEKYDLMNPLRDNVTSIKNEIREIQEKLTPFVIELEKIRSEREERRKEESVIEAREKLQGKKRLTIEDFRILLERNEIKFENS